MRPSGSSNPPPPTAAELAALGEALAASADTLASQVTHQHRRSQHHAPHTWYRASRRLSATPEPWRSHLDASLEGTFAQHLRAAAAVSVDLVVAHAEVAAECARFPSTGVLSPHAGAHLLAALWLTGRDWGDPAVELCARFVPHATLVDAVDRSLDRCVAGLPEREAHVARIILVEQPLLPIAEVRAAAVAACR